MNITLHIYTPEWNREETATAVFLPGALCPFEVLPGHAPIISTLSGGRLRWRTPAGEESIEIKGGAVKVENNIIDVCAEV